MRFPRDMFDLDVIKKAAYRFTDRCAFDFALDNDEILCAIRPLTGLSEPELAALEEDFRIEVLDQDLRRSISAETAAVRNAILAYTFSRTGLQDG
jgi:His-Xaa-Ser system protein HxsD